MDILSIEKKQIRFIIRQLVELKDVLNEVRRTKDASGEKLKKEINNILRKVRSGIFGCEERIEYKSARNFASLSEAFEKVYTELSSTDRVTMRKLLDKASVYNANLEKLGARGGKIELALREARDNYTDPNLLKKVETLLEDAIEADLAFESVVKELIDSAQKIKKVKSKFNAYKQLQDFAVLVSPGYYIDRDLNSTEPVIVLYDQVKFQEKRHTYEEFWKEVKSGNKRVMDDYNRYPKEDRDLNIYVNSPSNGIYSSIIGYCEMGFKYPRERYLGAYEIYRIAALPGFGPFFFELVFSWASLKHAPVVIDRYDASPAARKVWSYFDTDRKYIIKYPAALRKYPHSIGFTEEEVMKLYGPHAFQASVFDRYGFPEGLSGEKVEELKNKLESLKGSGVQRDLRSFIGSEGKPTTNLAVGGIASLDKAYYYDGEVNILAKLLKKGKTDKKYDKSFAAAGYFFFQYSKPRSGL